MCSNTLGPAMSPDLVTWPMRRTALPVRIYRIKVNRIYEVHTRS
jgi:hypothetical protein